MVATRAVLGCGGAERRRVPVWRLRAAGIVAARTAHGIFVETREPARCAAPAALAPGAHRPCRRQLPALLRPPRVLGGVRALRRLSLRLERVAGRRAAGVGRRARHDRAGHAGRRSEEHTTELQSLMRISYAV